MTYLIRSRDSFYIGWLVSHYSITSVFFNQDPNASVIVLNVRALVQNPFNTPTHGQLHREYALETA